MFTFSLGSLCILGSFAGAPLHYILGQVFTQQHATMVQPHVVPYVLLIVQGLPLTDGASECHLLLQLVASASHTDLVGSLVVPVESTVG